MPDLPVFASYQSSTVRSLRKSITEATRVSIAYATAVCDFVANLHLHAQNSSDASLLNVSLATWQIHGFDEFVIV